MNFDGEKMLRCFALGKIAMEKGDAPVGSFIVKSSEISALGRALPDVLLHDQTYPNRMFRG